MDEVNTSLREDKKREKQLNLQISKSFESKNTQRHAGVISKQITVHDRNQDLRKDVFFKNFKTFRKLAIMEKIRELILKIKKKRTIIN